MGNEFGRSSVTMRKNPAVAMADLVVGAPVLAHRDIPRLAYFLDAVAPLLIRSGARRATAKAA
jgi:hypothetical protein